MALETLDQFGNDDLDEATVAAIDRGEAEYVRGKGIPLDEGFAELRQKHFDI